MTAALHPGPQREPVPPEVLRVVKQVEIKARILADEALVGWDLGHIVLLVQGIPVPVGDGGC